MLTGNRSPFYAAPEMILGKKYEGPEVFIRYFISIVKKVKANQTRLICGVWVSFYLLFSVVIYLLTTTT